MKSEPETVEKLTRLGGEQVLWINCLKSIKFSADDSSIIYIFLSIFKYKIHEKLRKRRSSLTYDVVRLKLVINGQTNGDVRFRFPQPGWHLPQRVHFHHAQALRIPAFVRWICRHRDSIVRFLGFRLLHGFRRGQRVLRWTSLVVQYCAAVYGTRPAFLRRVYVDPVRSYPFIRLQNEIRSLPCNYYFFLRQFFFLFF